jgi:phosphate transport system substrate-binding protein
LYPKNNLIVTRISHKYFTITAWEKHKVVGELFLSLRNGFDSKNKKMEEEVAKKFIAVSVFVALMIMANFSSAEKIPQVRGSDTMVNLVQVLAENYSQKYPDRHVAVTGGGSGNGLAGLRNRTADIANSSREIRPREIIDMKGKGVEPVGLVVGKDCITIVVNEGNKVNKLTIGQLGDIFRGEIVNWKEVGGDDLPITLYGRQSNSGTFLVFRERVVKSDYSDRMNRMNGNSQIVEAVKNDVSGIGFVGLGHAEKATRLRIVDIAAEEGQEYISPTNRSDVESGRYLLARPIYQYTNGTPSGSIKDFIEFALSPEGQKIVDEMGFIPVTEEYQEQNRKILGV